MSKDVNMTEQPLVLTIDYGTQSVRVSIFDKSGTPVAMEQETYSQPYFSLKPGYAEQDPDLYYGAFCKAAKRLTKSNKDLLPRVKAMTQTCFRDSAVILDADRNVIRPMILWLDQRLAKCDWKLPWWSEALFRLVGKMGTIEINRKRTAANWIKENEPENWAKVDKYVSVSTYFIYRMIGELKDSPSSFTGHYPLDYKKKQWYAEPTKHLQGQIFSIEKRMLSELVPVGCPMGKITKECSEATGIPEGLILYSCGSDKSCETIGAGVIDSSKASMSLGTAASLETTIDKYAEPIPFLPSYPSGQDGCWNMDIQVYRGYWMINWFLKEFGCKNIVDLYAEEGDAPEYNKAMLDIPAGSHGLILQPYWGSNLDRPEARGAIIGFSANTTRECVYKSIVEGIAFELRRAKEIFEKKLKHKFSEIIVSGGGSKSDEICQLNADVLGTKVVKLHTHESSSLGAAITAFMAVGEFADYRSAVDSMVRVEKVFEPNPETHKIYSELFHKVYQTLYPTLRKQYKYLFYSPLAA